LVLFDGDGSCFIVFDRVRSCLIKFEGHQTFLLFSWAMFCSFGQPRIKHVWCGHAYHACSAACTVEYGPLNWPITTRVATERYITVKPSEVYPSRLYSWIDHLNIEPASRFQNAIMNWLLENWTHVVCSLYFAHSLHFFFPRLQSVVRILRLTLTGCRVKNASLFHRKCGKNNFGNQDGVHLREGDYQSIIIVTLKQKSF